jgi:hypothetical protein
MAIAAHLLCWETEALGEDDLEEAADEDDEDEDDDDEADDEAADVDMWLIFRLGDDVSHNEMECRRRTFSAEYWVRSFTTEQINKQGSPTGKQPLHPPPSSQGDIWCGQALDVE